MGSVGAFLVLESRANAEARGAHIYATIDAVEGDRGSRDDGRLEKRLERLSMLALDADPAQTLVFSGASGLVDPTARERDVIQKTFPGATLRGYGGVTGHGMEAQFPLGLALAALALDGDLRVPSFDSSLEQPMPAPANRAVVTTVGYTRGEGLAVLSLNA